MTEHELYVASLMRNRGWDFDEITESIGFFGPRMANRGAQIHIPVTTREIDEMERLWRKGMSYGTIGKLIGRSTKTVRRYLSERGL